MDSCGEEESVVREWGFCWLQEWGEKESAGREWGFFWLPTRTFMVRGIHSALLKKLLPKRLE
jgi:hypothetical protein